MPEPLNESSGPLQSIRRAATLPTKLNPQAQRGSAAPKLSENVIYHHPSARVVHFAPRALVPIPSSSAPSDFDYPVDTIETLPWRSATERTVATAPLRLERGLTVFLKCGNVVHAILKNSQCWCVDGVSKFVLRIRPLTYYRIELPHDTAEDKALVEDLKAALPTVLRYEVTPCPFKRAFTVELPEEAMAPRRKKAWKPKERKDSVPLLSGSNQGFHVESKSDWPDSASTGDDTDGAATDDSGLTPQRTNSTTSEAAPIGDESPIFTSDYGAPSNLAPTRRSITETPQTFTSLRAKFDATPVLEEHPTSDEPETKEESGAFDESAPVTNEPVVVNASQSDGSFSAKDAEVEVAPIPGDAPKSQHTSPSEAILESPALREDPSSTDDSQGQSVLSASPTGSNLEDASSTVPSRTTPTSVRPSEEYVPDSEAQVIFNSQEGPIQMGTSVAAENVAPEKVPNTQDLIPQHVPVPSESSDTELDHDVDRDISFSSTSESFHSVDLPRASGTHFAHTTSVDNQDAAPNAGPSVAISVAQLSAKQASVPELSEHGPLGLEVTNVFNLSKRSDNKTSQPELKMPKYIVREDPSKPSGSAPSSNKLAVTSATSPATDFRQMSTEFRRRAQATRQRDVSPMPPSSTIYQPPPSDQASSLLSKALSLVLVPPIHLFIILLHVAARIVISPAFNSSLGDSSSGSQSPKKEPVTEDDFSFPLERETSSEYEDAEISRKLDPWDLD